LCGGAGSSTFKETAAEWVMLYFSLGDFVSHPDRPEWGVGQVQSIVGDNVTVNFTHAGKQMINCAIIELVKTDLPERKRRE
jgi:transcription elongation factor GreA-like protein